MTACRKISAIIMVAAGILSVSCSGSRERQELFDTVYYAPEYAGGFEIRGVQGARSRVLRVKALWQGEETPVQDVFISRGGERPPEGFEGQVVDGDAERVAAMSSSYVAMMELLKEVPKIKAVSGLDFINNGYIRDHRDSVADVGSEADADYEALVSVRPDVVLLYGINSASAMESRLKKLGIPFVYMGEYLEKSPLGRAEWVVAVSEILGCRGNGEAVFRTIRDRYNALKKSVETVSERPSVMLNVPYGDLWYMTPPESAMAALINDAGARYVYCGKDEGASGNGSGRGASGNAGGTVKTEVIDSEEAFLLASEADFWLNTGQFRSVDELVAAYPEFDGVKSVADGRVFNCDRRVNAGGGNDFWESGPVRPDLVLSDLIRIFHPGLLPDDDLVYYRKLDRSRDFARDDDRNNALDGDGDNGQE